VHAGLALDLLAAGRRRLLLTVVNWRWLPETLHRRRCSPSGPAALLRGYAQLVSSARFLALAVASGIPFNGMFLYVLSAPVFLGEHLKLAPTQFFWFFICTVAGIMGGAWAVGPAGRPRDAAPQVRWGYRDDGRGLLNVALNVLWLPPHPAWAILPVALYAFGWSMMTPVVTLLLLDLVPDRRGMASSVQSSLGSAVNGLVAGVLAPLVMHSPLALAVASLALGATGLVGWTWVKRPGRRARRWTQVGCGHADKRCGDPPMTHLPLLPVLPTLAPLALALAAACAHLPPASPAPAKAEAKPPAKAPAKAGRRRPMPPSPPRARRGRPDGDAARTPGRKAGRHQGARIEEPEPGARDGPAGRAQGRRTTAWRRPAPRRASPQAAVQAAVDAHRADKAGRPGGGPRLPMAMRRTGPTTAKPAPPPGAA
jgi:hypothetical protein